MMKTPFLLLLPIVASLFNAHSTPGQVQVTVRCDKAPVSVKVPLINKGAKSVDVTVTNISGQPIGAIILAWRLKDSNGISVSQTNSVDYAISGRLMENQETLSMPTDIKVSGGADLAAAEVSCEAIIFGGSIVWGNKESPEVGRLLGIRQGIAFERNRLLDLYKREGVEKLREELARPVVK